jgi:hypothetical protein
MFKYNITAQNWSLLPNLFPMSTHLLQHVKVSGVPGMLILDGFETGYAQNSKVYHFDLAKEGDGKLESALELVANTPGETCHRGFPISYQVVIFTTLDAN